MFAEKAITQLRSYLETHGLNLSLTHTQFTFCQRVSDRFVMQQPLGGVPGIKVLHSDGADTFTDLSEESLGIPEGMNCKLTWSHTH